MVKLHRTTHANIKECNLNKVCVLYQCQFHGVAIALKLWDANVTEGRMKAVQDLPVHFFFNLL